MLKTPICPTCGCSLVRLGINKDDAATLNHGGVTYYFCCEGCLELFVSDPEKHLRETNGLIVCPVCLTEKPLDLTKELMFEGKSLRFCRCPHCVDAFRKKPTYYLERLEGTGDYAGIFGAASGPA